MPLEQGSQARRGRPWAALEKAPWLSNGTECPGVGTGEGKAVFILAANGPESQAAKLESDSGAVPVVACLHYGVLQTDVRLGVATGVILFAPVSATKFVARRSESKVPASVYQPSSTLEVIVPSSMYMLLTSVISNSPRPLGRSRRARLGRNGSAGRIRTYNPSVNRLPSQFTKSCWSRPHRRKSAGCD